MNLLHQALQTFWSSFSYGDRAIPAYLSGEVPDRQTNGTEWTESTLYPYFTYEAVDCSSFSSTVCTAFLWLKRGQSTFADRANIIELVRAAVPYEGTRITVGSGQVELYPNDSDFVTYYSDPDDDTIMGARFSLEMHYYY